MLWMHAPELCVTRAAQIESLLLASTAVRPNTLPFLPTPLRYHRMRLRWCGAALLALLQRWGVYVVVGLAMLGAFSAGGTTSIAAITAWSVLPLFKAAAQSFGLGVLLAALHALIGLGAVIALRPVLWSALWAEAERALPVPPRERLVSDAWVVLLALLPLFVIYAVGAVTWLAPVPDWLRGAEWSAACALALSMASSMAAGLLVLTAMRRPPRGASLRALTRAQAHADWARWRQPMWRALLLWPMTRGPARRTGRWLVGLMAGLLATDAAMASVRGQLAGAGTSSWCLAAWGLVSLAGTSRLYALVQRELAPLHDACAPLPISARQRLLARRLLALLPLIVGLVWMPVAWWLGESAVRPAVAGVYLLVSLVGHAWQLAGRQPQATTSNQSQGEAVRWVFTLVLLTALATEVFA